MSTLLGRLRGAAMNALFWGAAWFGMGFVLHLVFRALSGGRFVWPYELYSALHMAVDIGVTGAFVGAGFSAFIAANFRKQRAEKLSPWRFALGGSLVSALIMQVVLLLQDYWIWPFDLPRFIAYTGIYSLMGGATAFGTIKLAQRAEDIDLLESGPEELSLHRGSGTA